MRRTVRVWMAATMVVAVRRRLGGTPPNPEQRKPEVAANWTGSAPGSGEHRAVRAVYVPETACLLDGYAAGPGRENGRCCWQERRSPRTSSCIPWSTARLRNLSTGRKCGMLRRRLSVRFYKLFDKEMDKLVLGQPQITGISCLPTRTRSNYSWIRARPGSNREEFCR